MRGAGGLIQGITGRDLPWRGGPPHGRRWGEEEEKEWAERNEKDRYMGIEGRSDGL